MPPNTLRDPHDAIPALRLRELQHVIHQLAEDVRFRAGPASVQLASYTRDEGQRRYIFHLLVLSDDDYTRTLIEAMCDDVEAAMDLLPGHGPGVVTADRR
jgi:hypothetical protein